MNRGRVIARRAACTVCAGRGWRVLTENYWPVSCRSCDGTGGKLGVTVAEFAREAEVSTVTVYHALRRFHRHRMRPAIGARLLRALDVLSIDLSQDFA